MVRETIGTGTTAQVLDFIYDANGRPFALKYTNGTADAVTYYYVLNLQGDVVGLIDENADFVAEYTYNAWGEILTATGTMAEINPLRYRGYYYDSETGFYYLQSRYYDPAMHRFINADAYASTGTGALGYNMFAYCGNNPVMHADPSGESWIEDVFNEILRVVYNALQRNTATSDKLCDMLSVKDDAYLTGDQIENNASLIYKYLSNEGWSHNAICAVLGNMECESTISPGRHQVGGNAFGLVQWDPASKYLNWASKNGYAENSMAGQLKYLIYSMQPGQGEWFNNGNYSGYYLDSNDFICSNESVEYLTAVFVYSYERPGVVALDKRVACALAWSEYFKN